MQDDREAIARVICGFGPKAEWETWGPATQSTWNNALKKADAILALTRPSQVQPGDVGGDAHKAVGDGGLREAEQAKAAGDAIAEAWNAYGQAPLDLPPIDLNEEERLYLGRAAVTAISTASQPVQPGDVEAMREALDAVRVLIIEASDPRNRHPLLTQALALIEKAKGLDNIDPLPAAISNPAQVSPRIDALEEAARACEARAAEYGATASDHNYNRFRQAALLEGATAIRNLAYRGEE